MHNVWPSILSFFYYSKWCTLRWVLCKPTVYSVVVINDACNQSTNTIQLSYFYLVLFSLRKIKDFWESFVVVVFFFFIWIMFSMANGYLFNVKKGNWKLKKFFFCFKARCFSMPFRGWWIISFTIGFSQPKENNISDIFRSIRYTLSLYSVAWNF